jgi:hypothetical protein
MRKLSPLAVAIAGKLLDPKYDSSIDKVECPITGLIYESDYDPTTREHFYRAGGHTYTESFDQKGRCYVRILNEKGLEIAYTYDGLNGLTL